MKNKAINTLTYTGIVTLSQYIGSKKVKIAEMHNSGGASLFSFLANCLAGDFSFASKTMPAKVRFLEREHSKVDDTYSYRELTQFVPYRTPPVPKSSSDGSSVRYSFVIPREYIEHLEVSNLGNTLGLGLYAANALDEDIDDCMAFCELAEIDKNSMVNTYLVVDWELIISNTASGSKATGIN